MKRDFKLAWAGMQNRATVLCGRTLGGAPIETATRAEIKSLVESPVKEEEVIKRIREAHENPDKQRVLNAMRLQQTRNYLYSSLGKAAMFFNVIELKKDERPGFENKTKQQTYVHYIAPGTKARRRSLVAERAIFPIPLDMLATEKVDYPIWDIYQGDVRDPILATIDLSFDRKAKVEDLAWTVFQAGFGDFTLTGNRVSRVYVANDRIAAGVLPTTNVIEVPGSAETGDNSKMRFQVLDEIIAYADRWTGAFNDRKVRPTGRVLVSPLDTTGLLKQVTYTGSDSNRLPEEVRKNYTTVSHGGIDWVLIPDNTLPAGTCYPEFNEKVGDIYFKPELEMEDVNSDIHKNLEERSQIFPFGCYMPVQNRPWMLKVVFKGDFD